MIYRAFQTKRFRAATLAIIGEADSILTDYVARGFDLTLRQLYYQFVSLNRIENTEREYKRLTQVVNDGRLAGLLPWDALVDRTRSLRTVPTWDSPGSIVETAANQFRTDPWQLQPTAVEVWVEKDALVGVIGRPCDAYAVPFFSCRGFASLTSMYEAAQRIGARKKPTLILHLGDHDPSGLDMTRDIRERLSLLCATPFEVSRIALSREQIETYRLPPNPAKQTDARWKAYAREHGRQSWELDALRPEVIEALVREHIEANTDKTLFEQSEAEDREGRERIEGLARHLGIVA